MNAHRGLFPPQIAEMTPYQQLVLLGIKTSDTISFASQEEAERWLREHHGGRR